MIGCGDGILGGLCFFGGGNVCFLYIAKLFVRRHSSYLGVVAPWERRDGGGTWERSDGTSTFTVWFANISRTVL